jgi:hypothetical protein
MKSEHFILHLMQHFQSALVTGWQYTVVGTVTLCRQSSTKIEFGQSGWLARRLGLAREERHQKRGPFAILGLQMLEPAGFARHCSTRWRFESIRNSKIVRCHRPWSIILKNAELAIGLTVLDMLHKQRRNEAASFAWVSSGLPDSTVTARSTAFQQLKSFMI